MLPITDYIGQLGGGVYNNINVTYEPWVKQGSNAHRGWAAASTLNALAEFRRQAQADGMAAPPNLDIYLVSNDISGFALMKRYLGKLRVQAAFNVALLQSNFFKWLLLHTYTYGNNSFDFVYPLIPDMMLGVNFHESDMLRRLEYHELTHASHFTNVGPDYWMLLAIAEIGADNNIGLLSDSPDPHYNAWILSDPDDLFYKFGGIAFMWWSRGRADHC